MIWEHLLSLWIVIVIPAAAIVNVLAWQEFFRQRKINKHLDNIAGTIDRLNRQARL